MITYKIKRVKDGKFARQTRFFGSTNWGVGQTFHMIKPAAKNFRNLVFKRDKNWPYGGDTNRHYDGSTVKNPPKEWGTLQLLEVTVDEEAGTYSEKILEEE